MGISQHDPELTSHDGALDEQYHRIKNDPHNTAGLPYEGTTQQITELHMRHFIMRETPPGSKIAAWVNAMNEVAEGTRLGIPVIVAANSKNELGGFKMGATAADRDFTQWPGTLGLAATGDLDLIARLRREVADRVGGLRPAQGLHVHGRHGHRPAVVPDQRHLRRGPGVQRPGDRRGRARLPGRATVWHARRGGADHQALPRGRRPGERVRPALRRGQVQRLPDARVAGRPTTCRRSRRRSTPAPPA